MAMGIIEQALEFRHSLWRKELHFVLSDSIDFTLRGYNLLRTARNLLNNLSFSHFSVCSSSLVSLISFLHSLRCSSRGCLYLFSLLILVDVH
jgi:hypothetical protein